MISNGCESLSLGVMAIKVLKSALKKGPNSQPTNPYRGGCDNKKGGCQKKIEQACTKSPCTIPPLRVLTFHPFNEPLVTTRLSHPHQVVNVFFLPFRIGFIFFMTHHVISGNIGRISCNMKLVILYSIG